MTVGKELTVKKRSRPSANTTAVRGLSSSKYPFTKDSSSSQLAARNSTSEFAWKSAATRANKGSSAWHGPHQVAQKLRARTFPLVSLREKAVPSGAFLSVKSEGSRASAFFFGLTAREACETSSKVRSKYSPSPTSEPWVSRQTFPSFWRISRRLEVPVVASARAKARA